MSVSADDKHRQPRQRAEPPRPSLLVGDLDACVRAWADLRRAALAALSQQQWRIRDDASAGASYDGDPLVRRFRSLRESLTSWEVEDEFALEVYELSADVCAVSRNHAELLKCLHQLVTHLYPAQDQRQQQALQQRQQAEPQQQQQQYGQHAQQQQQQQQGQAVHTSQPQVTDHHTEHGQHTHDMPYQQHHKYQPQQQQAWVPQNQDSAGGSSHLPQQLPHLPPGLQHNGQSHTVADPWDDGDIASTGGPESPRSSSQSSTLTSSAAAAATAARYVRAGSSKTIPGSSMRRAEVHAALLLYFVCVPQQPVVKEMVRRLRGTSAVLMASSSMQLALRAATAMLSGRWVTYFHCYSSSPMLVRLVMEAGMSRVHTRALSAVALSYRSIPVATLRCWLLLTDDYNDQTEVASSSTPTATLHPHSQLKALLTSAHQSGSRGAGVALQAIADAEHSGSNASISELVFR
eukprot:jgi/Chrzof1/13339/Cz07g29130.t1